MRCYEKSGNLERASSSSSNSSKFRFSLSLLCIKKLKQVSRRLSSIPLFLSSHHHPKRREGEKKERASIGTNLFYFMNIKATTTKKLCCLQINLFLFRFFIYFSLVCFVVLDNNNNNNKNAKHKVWVVKILDRMCFFILVSFLKSINLLIVFYISFFFLLSLLHMNINRRFCRLFSRFD